MKGSRRSAQPIKTLKQLHTHLQWALELEHATIPPYFAAWTSIRPGTNIEAANVIRSVLVEEMLHLVLVANVLNAVGGTPCLTHDRFVPDYPTRLPHSSADFKVSIAPLSPGTIRTFLEIEHPAPSGIAPQPDQYTSIGAFYGAIRDGIDYLCAQLGRDKVFCGNRSRQVQPDAYYVAGKLITVTGLEDAHQAITEIVHQGEGAPRSIFDDDESMSGRTRNELAHYFRFRQLAEGRHYRQKDTATSGPRGRRLDIDYDSVLPARSNTRLSDHPRDSALRAALVRFTNGYARLLSDLEAVFNGQPSSLVTAISRMFTLRNQALEIMRTPDPDRHTSGLTFERPHPTTCRTAAIS